MAYVVFAIKSFSPHTKLLCGYRLPQPWRIERMPGVSQSFQFQVCIYCDAKNVLSHLMGDGIHELCVCRTGESDVRMIRITQIESESSLGCAQTTKIIGEYFEPSNKDYKTGVTTLIRIANTIGCDVYNDIYVRETKMIKNKYVIDHDNSLDVISNNNISYSYRGPVITRVIINEPGVIVFWSDDTKTTGICREGDIFDAEVGLAMAIAKKFYMQLGYPNPRGAFKQQLKNAENHTDRTKERKTKTVKEAD